MNSQTQNNISVQNSPKRLDQLDIAKGLGILMVTYGHITRLGNPVDNWVAIIKVPVFYIVAGILFAMKSPEKKLSLKAYTCKLWKSIGIPYVSFSAVYILAIISKSIIRGVPIIPQILGPLYETITLRGATTLWFLPCLALGEILFFLLLKARSKILLGTVFVILPPLGLLFHQILLKFSAIYSERMYDLISAPYLTVTKSICVVWFLEAGYLGYLLVQKLAFTKKVKFAVGILFVILTIVFSKYMTHIDVNNISFSSKPVLFFSGSVLGSFGVIFMAEYLCQYMRFPILSYFGKNSLSLMAVQRCLFLLVIIESGWKKIFRLEDVVCKRYYLETFGILIGTLVLSYGVIEIINRYFPFLAGKKADKTLKELLFK